MEQDRFDALAISLADEGASRRSVLGRLAAGGVAAALGITAFTSLDGEDVEAKGKKRKKPKNCFQKCNRKKKKSKRNACKQKCAQATPAGFPITVNTTLLGTVCTVGGNECGTGTGLQCVGLICVPITLGNVGDVCVTGADCATGQCNGVVCAQCDVANVCGVAGSQQCCVADADCIANLCVLPG